MDIGGAPAAAAPGPGEQRTALPARFTANTVAAPHPQPQEVAVPVQPPSREELQRIAREFHFDLSDEELETFAAAAPATLAGFARLDELPDEHLAGKYPRRERGRRATGADTPSNGWAWKFSTPGAAEGPLAGRRVGVKDNVCVAGVPMLNGSPIMEGYVPREDATVVTRLLEPRAEVVAKTAVPAFCFDLCGLTVRPDAQPTNPHDAAYLCGSS